MPIYKGYFSQRYPVSIKVRVTWNFNGVLDTHIDAIKGLNKGHALYNARAEYPGADIQYIKTIRADERLTF